MSVKHEGKQNTQPGKLEVAQEGCYELLLESTVGDSS